MGIEQVKEFIELNIDHIDNNEFEILYSKFRSLAPTRDLGLLTNFLLEAEINPLNYMDRVPRFYAFNSQSITEITLPPHLEAIHERSFEKCHRLQRVNMLPKTRIKYIEKYSFMECNRLETIIFPRTLEALGDSVFEKCVQLRIAICDSELGKIPYRTFCLCTNLQRVDLPYAIVEIGEEAFRYCKALHSIVIPSHVTKLGNKCFADSGLEQIFFGGTKEQWKAIKKYSTWHQDVPNAITVHCADGNLIERHRG